MYADVRMTVTEEQAEKLLVETLWKSRFWRVVEKPFEHPQTELVVI